MIGYHGCAQNGQKQVMGTTRMSPGIRPRTGGLFSLAMRRALTSWISPPQAEKAAGHGVRHVGGDVGGEEVKGG